MREVCAALPPNVRSAILMQGEESSQELLRKHRARVRNAMPSILFGLNSFADGLDLPGALCVRVVIAKIPFPSPDDPVLASASEHLQRKGLHPFPILWLPEASIRLKQGFGRLIRSEDDYGEVILLDTRARSKQYARSLLAGLPLQPQFH